MKEKLIKMYDYCLTMAEKNREHDMMDMYHFWTGKAEGIRVAIDMLEEEKKVEKQRRYMKRIKVKGDCPKCKSRMIWGSWEYVNEPLTREYLPVCTNEHCDLSCGYGSDVKFRFINHRTVKIEGLYN